MERRKLRALRGPASIIKIKRSYSFYNVPNRRPARGGTVGGSERGALAPACELLNGTAQVTRSSRRAGEQGTGSDREREEERGLEAGPNPWLVYFSARCAPKS